jgi:hypothetical protein
MAVGIPWPEFQYGLGPGVQDPGVDVGKSNDKGETASESARLAAERSMGDEAMKLYEDAWFKERLKRLDDRCHLVHSFSSQCHGLLYYVSALMDNSTMTEK